ncbi:NAD-dependent epimerase/dehydratase family protein [Stenotrophomonas sp. 24(2023)]|uniref:NAD-dependent epimerase/dehydratase family protein n=1 Tax=Stenotrophomonas sp. 24(2023) TaxID=3068324 RepID=UPI0027E08100|nr:NAD-dependent epimerase/dehydratase family protein [Stenotrophomonas sp. 24(2023)]WMJ69446.1 NAD(P)H-binding protein [Stenotrophomonas sp. 24(2023)]
MNHGQTALVLGATGGIGGETAQALKAAGWRVRAMARRLPADTDGLAWVQGDALRADDVQRAAQGCAVIVHAVNPPGYRDWQVQVLPMIDNSIAAARQAGATLVLPGTVYNYGPDAFANPHEQAPQHPATRKGALRVALEEKLQAASAEGLRVIILRAGDFFGPRPGNNWFSQGLVKAGLPVARVFNPGLPGIGHQWAYLPDAARTLVALLQRRAQLPAFARFHMAGHWDADGQQMAQAIAEVVQRVQGRRPAVWRFPWWSLALAAPFNTTLRELREMRYLWRVPLHMDNAALRAVIGPEPHTPLAEAVETTLRGLGCLPAPLPAGHRAA